MPAPRQWPPRLHIQGTAARVSWRHKWYHLGKAGTPEAQAAYLRLIALWREDPNYRPQATRLLVGELCRDYAKAAPFPPGKRKQYLRALDLLTQLYAAVPVEEFGPLALSAWQGDLASRRKPDGTAVYSRTYISMLVAIIRGVWRWGVATQRVAPDRLAALKAVRGLRIDQARPGRTVRPVDDGTFASVLPFLPRPARGLVLLLRYTGARPGELFGLRPVDVDRSQDIWSYKLSSHKTASRGGDRIIEFGLKSQAVLLEHWPRSTDLPFFGHSRGLYNRHSLGNALKRAGRRAGVKPFTAYQCRHARATELRASHGLATAGAVLGHSRLEVTLGYAEQSRALARAAAEASG